MDENQNKTQVKYVLFLLTIVVIVLVGILIYLLIKPRLGSNQNLESEGELKTERQENTTVPEDDNLNTGTSQPQNNIEVNDEENTEPATEEEVSEDSTQDNTQYYKSEIDKDINSLDSLDLSTPENDLGDDKVEEL